MKKQIIKRGLFGLPVGIAIGFVIPLLISAAVGDGNYYPVTPQLIETMGNELHAVGADGSVRTYGSRICDGFGYLGT